MSAPDDAITAQISTELKFVCSSVAPLIFHCGKFRGMPPTITGGTTFFLDTGQRRFGVTACHVVDAFFELATHCLQPLAFVARHGRPPYLIDIRNRIIDRDPAIDIATFALSIADVVAVGRHLVRGPQSSWPPDLANNGDAVYYCGFPGIEREWVSQSDVSFGFTPMGGYVASAREDRISIQIERATMVDIGPVNMPDNYNFGGMSGAPLFARRLSGTLHVLSPVGVIIQGPNASGDLCNAISGLEIIAARPIQFIAPDGTLDRNRWQTARPFA
jgi:hypothetical protein